jgi:hypothetical protein
MTTRANTLLDELAEKYRHPNIPGPSLRQLWTARSGGSNWRAVSAAIKEINRS